MVADPEWFLELTRQTHKRRFVATGGALKDVHNDNPLSFGIHHNR
ncbi:protein rep [Salmonella enterica subsp. enterica serovar Kentucky]|nr:protein rep [Salmonella enterica subsp. enterica serovar Kentucky]